MIGFARARRERHHVYLVPGFFGFANFGDFRYFSHVREVLDAWARARGIELSIHYAPTSPTASLRTRAGKLAERISATAGAEGPIHLVGHSTGGLDARLLVTPGVSLRTSVDVERIARRVRTVVAVCTPHHGTPTAAFFTSLLGQKLLGLLSLVTIQVIRVGTIPMPAIVLLASAIGSTGAGKLVSGGIVEQVYELVLKDFSVERRRQIEQVLAEVERDQTLLPQLTPEGLDLFDALAVDRPGVRCGSVVAQARPPSAWRQLRVGASPTAQAMYNLYRALWVLASSSPEARLPEPTAAQARALRRAFGSVPDARSNDAIVPTRSQVWGEVVHAAWADHLDVIGHFQPRRSASRRAGEPGPKSDDAPPVHADWIRTMSGFGNDEFAAVWSDVARFAFAD